MQLRYLGAVGAALLLTPACGRAPAPVPAVPALPAPAAVTPVVAAPSAAPVEADVGPAVSAFFGAAEPAREAVPKPWLAVGSGWVALPDGGRATFALVALQPDPGRFTARVVVDEARAGAAPVRRTGLVRFLARTGGTVTFAGTMADGTPFTGRAADRRDAGGPDTFSFTTPGWAVDGPIEAADPPGRVRITELEPKT